MMTQSGISSEGFAKIKVGITVNDTVRGSSSSSSLPDAVVALAESMSSKIRVVAKAELARRRSRLGQITAEQERALEEVLTSIIERVSEPILRRVRQHSGVS